MARPGSIELIRTQDALSSSLGAQSSPLREDSTRLLTCTSRKSWSFYMSILLLGLVGFTVALDATSLIVALPVVAQDVEGTSLESFWAGISFMLAVTITQPIYASTSDVLGRKYLLYVSMLLFTTGSAVFAVAKSMSVIILGRVLQGLGGGGLDILQVIILSDITTLRERPMYMGVNAVFNALGNVAGLVSAGVFSELVSWRWLGWINLPLMGVTFLITIFFLHLKPLEMDTKEKLRSMDWLGLILYGSGAISVALPLSWAGSLFLWLSWQTLVPLLTGVALLGVLAWYERKPLKPVFPYRIFKNTTTRAAILSGTIHGLLIYTVQAYLPLFFQAVFLRTTIQSAISSLPFCASFVGFSAISGIIVNLMRRYCLVLLMGWLLMTTFLGLLCSVKRDTAGAEIYLFQVFAGIGVGTVLTITAIPTQASVQDVDDTGIAAGMLVNFRLFGALIGLTLGSNIFNSVFEQKINSLGTLPTSIQRLQNANEAIGFIPSLRKLDLPDPLMSALLDAFWAPFQVLWIVMTCFSGIGFFIALFIKELSLEKDEVGRQGFQQPSP